MTTLAAWNERLLYSDCFSRYGYEWVEDSEGATYQKQNSEADIVDAPCYLSISKNALGNSLRMDKPNSSKVDHNTIEQVLLMFCDPKYDIKAGDLLRISHGGECFDYIAGKPHRYESYQEMLVYSLIDA